MIEKGKQLERLKLAKRLQARAYEGALQGRRTENWRTANTSANAELRPSLPLLRARCRDLVRNNGYAKQGVRIIKNSVVGYGIATYFKGAGKYAVARMQSTFDTWANSTDCDADGLHTLQGLQALAMNTIIESGEVLIRTRWRKSSDGLTIPMQLQVLEPDFLDVTKDGFIDTGRIVQGVQFDLIGRRVGYWLYKDHPGDTNVRSLQSTLVPAEEVAHVYLAERPGQVRGVPWLAPCIIRMRDFDEYEDTQLIRQKIAACFSVFYYDREGEPANTDVSERVEPGIIEHLPPGSDVQIANPPEVQGFEEYSRVTLRGVASALGVPYEALTGDYTNSKYSSARMARIAFFSNLDDWQYNMLIPRMCHRVTAWFLRAATLAGITPPKDISASYTVPSRQMTDPSKDVPATRDAIRSGLMTQSEAIRERGYSPEAFYAEMRADNEAMDAANIVLDSDARQDKAKRAGA